MTFVLIMISFTSSVGSVQYFTIGNDSDQIIICNPLLPTMKMYRSDVERATSKQFEVQAFDDVLLNTPGSNIAQT